MIMRISSFILACILCSNIMAKPPKEKIAVVGAGLAGLTAAYRLQQKNLDVEVFEARPRVGGRVHTVWLKNVTGSYEPAELGGYNINDGGDAVHFLQLVKEFQLPITQSTLEVGGQYYDGYQFHSRRQVFAQLRARDKNIFEKIDALAKTCSNMQ